MKLSKGITLLFLGLFFKVAVAEDSTQVFWLELEIESSVYDNITAHLREQTRIDITNATVTNISLTTDCKFDGLQKNCSCKEEYTLNEEMYKNYDCCNDTCTLNVNTNVVCLPKTRVSIKGSTKFEISCTILFDSSQKNHPDYKPCEEYITKNLTEIYSKLKYFDSLIINGYRPGSVIVEYTVLIMSSIQITDLENIANLYKYDLNTTGLVDIKVDNANVIEIGSSTNVSCTPPPQLSGVDVNWYLTNQQNKTTQITTGKEATLMKVIDKNIVQLKDISGSWKGIMKCVYTKGSIRHTASTKLDIVLLPEIQIMSKPQFPDCRDKNNQEKVEIKCTILADDENYNVTWNTALSYTNEPQQTGTSITYSIKVNIVCATEQETVNVGCIFRNTRSPTNASRSQNVSIPIITPNSQFCNKEGVWPIAKSNYVAILPCTDGSVGFTSRNCTNKVWGNEISSCVNPELHNVQQAVEELNKGIGFIKDDADSLFKQVQQTTIVKTFQTFANINASVLIFHAMNKVSEQQSNQWNYTIMPDFVSSISNALNETDPWKDPRDGSTHLSVKYLQTIEQTIHNSNLSMTQPVSSQNVKLTTCNNTGEAVCGDFKANVKSADRVVVVAFRNLHELLPQYKERPLDTTVLSVTTVNNVETTDNESSVEMLFEDADKRLKNHEMYCIFWDETKQHWSSEGCVWGGAANPRLCTCTHNSAFTIMMSKDAETLPYENELTYAGLGVSIVSLVLCLIIEFLVWDTVVKSDISNFRHVALVNISLCLLFAHCTFLASSDPKTLPDQWCSILTVIKHFFFLAVFFWMLCLSFVLLHQMIFVFDQLRKKVFLVLSIFVGYVCPLICVTTTYITFENGAEGKYFSKDTCWLIYEGLLKGSLFSFVIPALTIVIVNLFTLVVVIMKIATPTVSDSKARDQKDVAKSMIKTIVFLSPVLGLTWLLGILVLYLDLTQKPYAQIVHYSFTLLNSLQGFLILLTNCLLEKKIRDALSKRFKSKKSVQAKGESSGKATSSVMMTK